MRTRAHTVRSEILHMSLVVHHRHNRIAQFAFPRHIFVGFCHAIFQWMVPLVLRRKRFSTDGTFSIPALLQLNHARIAYRVQAFCARCPDWRGHRVCKANGTLELFAGHKGLLHIDGRCICILYCWCVVIILMRALCGAKLLGPFRRTTRFSLWLCPATMVTPPGSTNLRDRCICILCCC